MLTQAPIKDIIRKQREFFATGKTKDVEWRIEQLKRLKQAVVVAQEAIVNAVKADLGRPDFEAYFEVAAIAEINYALSWFIVHRSLRTAIRDTWVMGNG